MSRFSVIFIMAGALFLSAPGPTHADDWLVDADEKTRAERLSSYLGGFSAAMWEVGERYQHVVQAIRDENFELAHYHWDKIGDAIRGGYLKRPDRQANADKLFLDGVWKTYLATLDAGQTEAIREEFPQARAACLTCHVAEGVEFMNNQPMFTELDID